ALIVRKLGPGTLILNATNQEPFFTFNILGGVLIPMSEGAFGSGAYHANTNVTVNGGTLQLVAPIPNHLVLSGNGAGGTSGTLMVPPNSSIRLTETMELLGGATINVAQNASL